MRKFSGSRNKKSFKKNFLVTCKEDRGGIDGGGIGLMKFSPPTWLWLFDL